MSNDKKTKVFEDEFKGNKILAIWEVDENEQKKGERPIVAMGIRKLKAISKHSNEIMDFLRSQE